MKTVKALLKAAFILIAVGLAYISITLAVVFIVATMLAALHERAGVIAELSFGPLKAKLEREVSQAEKLVNKLRDFAAVQARAAIAASASTGRLASGDDWVFQSTKRLEAALVTLGIDDALIREARSDLVTLTVRDMAGAILGGSYVPAHLNSDAGTEWKQLRSHRPYPDPDDVEAWLTRHGQMNEHRAKRIADMRWMIEHQDIRDSAQYMRAHTPVEWSK